jgi:Zinc-finger of C2H2 type
MSIMESSYEPTSESNRPSASFAYYCDACGARFSNEGALRSHQKLQHGEAVDPIELQVPWVPREPMNRSLDRLPEQDGVGEARPASPTSDEALPPQPTEAGGSKVDENLLPDEDLDATRSRSEREGSTKTPQNAGSTRRTVRRMPPGRRARTRTPA